jgi:thioester reductase-like protein
MPNFEVLKKRRPDAKLKDTKNSIMTSTPEEDIRKEPLISKRWGFTPSRPSTYPDGILITGANSFIGTHVVSRLHRQWDGPAHLLLRAATKREAVGKMNHAFETWKLGVFQPELFSIHLGDVTQNMMGLNVAEYNTIKKETGVVLHLAMNPMYNLPYAHFKRLWLPELARMIAFCGDKDFPKSLHYPSSFSTHFFTEDDDFRHLNTNAWQSGYAGFKWVAGKMLQNAYDQHLRGCLYDIPPVMGSEEKGLCPTHYPVWHLLDIFLKTGLYTDFIFSIIPVDVLSEVIVTNLILDREDKGKRFLRPVLSETVTHKQFGNTVANILGLKHTTRENLSKAYADRQRFDFIIPPGFYKLLEKANHVPAVWPENYQIQHLPEALMVFLSNLNRILTQKKTQATTS